MRDNQRRLFEHLATEAVQDCLVGLVDLSAGTLPFQGETVVCRALDEEDAVFVDDDGADDEAGQGGVGGEVCVW